MTAVVVRFVKVTGQAFDRECSVEAAAAPVAHVVVRIPPGYGVFVEGQPASADRGVRLYLAPAGARALGRALLARR